MILGFHGLLLLKTPNDRAGLPTKSPTNPAALRSPPKILPHSFQHPAPSGEHGRKTGTHTAAAQRCLGLDTPQLCGKQLIFFKHSHFLAAPPVHIGPSLWAASVPSPPWASTPLRRKSPSPRGHGPAELLLSGRPRQQQAPLSDLPAFCKGDTQLPAAPGAPELRSSSPDTGLGRGTHK